MLRDDAARLPVGLVLDTPPEAAAYMQRREKCSIRVGGLSSRFAFFLSHNPCVSEDVKISIIVNQKIWSATRWLLRMHAYMQMRVVVDVTAEKKRESVKVGTSGRR